MKNITFAAQKHRTLNELFREWLNNFSLQEVNKDIASRLQGLWKHTNYLQVGKKLSRDEMNE